MVYTEIRLKDMLLNLFTSTCLHGSQVLACNLIEIIDVHLIIGLLIITG